MSTAVNMDQKDTQPANCDILDVSTGIQQHVLITEVSGLTTPTDDPEVKGETIKEVVVDNEGIVKTEDGDNHAKKDTTEDPETPICQDSRVQGETTDAQPHVKDGINGCKNDTEQLHSSKNKSDKTETNNNSHDKPRNKLAMELDRLQAEDDMREERARRRYQRDVRRTKRAMDKARREKGIELYPDINKTKAAIKKVQTDEEYFALSKDRAKLDEETNKLKHEIDDKFGILLREERPDITSLAENLFSKTRGDPEIPGHITRVLTRQEIEDLRLVFGMFDVKGKGYIDDRDLKRLVKMLGFRASRKVFDGMIRELAGDTDRVTFVNFLEFIVKSQGEGPDPFGEIKQSFQLLDTEDKGYVTFEDLRLAVDDNKLTFSNRMLKEMMQDADKSGDGKLTLQEYTNIMLHTSRFKFV